MTYPTDDGLRPELDALYTTAGNAVSDLAGVVPGADVLASQFADVKNALDDLQSFVDNFRSGYYYTPVGVVVPFAGGQGDKPPSGWFVCNGDAFNTPGVDLSAGDALYDLLVGAGWSALPDLRGRAVLGAGTGSGLSARSLRDAIGAETLPAHTHTINHDHGAFATTDGAGTHAHTINSPVSGLKYYTDGIAGGSRSYLATAASGGVTYNSANVSGNTSSAGGHNHTIDVPSFSGTSGYTGTGNHGVMQPSLVLNYLIKG